MEPFYVPVRNDIQRMLQREKKRSMKWAIYTMLLFGKDQKKSIDEACENGYNAIKIMLSGDIDAAMSKYNS